MEFTQLWEALCNKQPKLRDPQSEVAIKSDAFRKLLQRAHTEGQKSTHGAVAWESLAAIFEGARRR